MVIAASSISAQSPSISTEDLGPLAGGIWTGTLTYVDYGSGKRTSIKCNLKVSSAEAGTWVAEYIYPDEPKANSTSRIQVSNEGREFAGQRLVEKVRDKDGVLRFVTETEDTDNNKRALFRFTYVLSAKQFSIRKDVKVVGTAEFFERNTYSWTRE